MKLSKLSDDQLLSSLNTICGNTRRLDVQLILHLIEIEDRRLHLKAACSSIFEFCVLRLHMSEGSAFRRMVAARMARKHPRVLDYLESGKLHLSAVVLLRDHVTDGNVEELFGAASGKSKREVAQLVATRAPRPDVPSRIRKLPVARPVAPGVAQVEPLAAARYKVQLTVSAEQKAKIERAKDLMRHRNPTGDLAVIIEQALDALIEKVEKERLAKTSRPRPLASAERTARSAEQAGQTRVPAATRREVFARDGEQCTFVDEHDRRCASRGFLEIDHITSRAHGGSNDAANLRVRCRAHNQLHAEEAFGQKYVEGRIHFRQHKSQAADRAAAQGAERSRSRSQKTPSEHVSAKTATAP